ncbi:uncharacterized protein LOC107045443 [Diachasma alloeum]|uniref:uncharacterized protein LOC107045443 n=1 Tax=Diachasma alloeum TaxID=454923 RepID=UPI0007384A25|nr:uncharacterized protein LOC107045443 [Diachasma alloeum]
MKTPLKDLKFRDVWRVCNKIRAAVFRIDLNLWDYFKPLDPNNNGLISGIKRPNPSNAIIFPRNLKFPSNILETKFIAIFTGPLRHCVGLSDPEIADLTDYFSIQDGRIIYSQLCQVIHDSVPEFMGRPMITGLEWEEPLAVNRLSCSEHRKLNLIITQISINVRKRTLVLRPYFQDYELISKNTGTVTIAHFGRILHFLGIVLAPEEFSLLVKRFAKDGYTLNYVAFLKAIDDAQNYMDDHGMLHVSGELLDQFPGRVITAELPKLPRPEVGRVLASEAFGKQSVFHPGLKRSRERMRLIEMIRRIQRHVLERRIRIHTFLEPFDEMNVGRITPSQFRRGLDSLQVSSLGQLYLAEHEIEELVTFYLDPNDTKRVMWRVFEDDIDHVFTIKELDKYPCLKVDSPPPEVKELPKLGQNEWQSVAKDMRKLCEETVQKVRYRVDERGINTKQFFKDYDRLNHGHVSRSQLRQILTAATILLSQEEIFALEQRYNDEMGFNYARFLQELEALPITRPLYEKLVQEKRLLNAERPLTIPCRNERDIVLILGKIKAKVVRERVKVTEFLRGFDPRNELAIPRNDFARGMDQIRCNLTPTEIETIMDVFKAPLRAGFVDYERFGNAVEEAVTIRALEKSPLLVPVQHVPSYASPKTFLNFEERQTIVQAMDKLVRIRNHNLEQVFKDFDKENIGTVTKDQMTKALSVRKMLELLSMKEVDTLHKCFSIERGMRLELDYRAFLRALELVQGNKRILHF